MRILVWVRGRRILEDAVEILMIGKAASGQSSPLKFLVVIGIDAP